MARLLIVEHERSIARAFAPRLTKRGYTGVAMVGSGREAVQPGGDLGSDPVLIDIGLPGEIDGPSARTTGVPAPTGVRWASVPHVD